MKRHWLILSFFSVFLGCAPAEAGKLLSWQFDNHQNELNIRTDTGVQPVVKLIENPTRLVIDLPGMIADLNQGNQMVGGAVKSVRVGQFQPDIARLVVELEPGYTINPKDVKIRGLSSTRWIVNIPEPQKGEARDIETDAVSENQDIKVVEPPAIASRDFQVTKNGLFVRFEQQDGHKIRVERSSDRRQIEISLTGVALPESLANQSVALNQYGVEEIQFKQDSLSPAMATIIMNVAENSSDWLASYSRIGEGGLVLLPKQREVTQDNQTARSTPTAVETARVRNQEKTIIESITLAANNSQLLINGDRRLEVQGSMKTNGVYQIRLYNAQLANNFTNPQITTNAPISRLRIWQENPDTVVVLVHPALGVRIQGEVEQPGEKLVVLQLQELTRVSRVIEDVAAPPPSDSQADTPPLERAWARVRNNAPNQEKIVVMIDPGHGGKDPGAIGIGGVQEKRVILPMAQQVAAILEKQGIQVIMTRNSDYYVSLKDRTVMANRAGADIFVSIHANSMGMSRPDVNGIETYYFQDGRELAEKIHNSMLRSVDVANRGVRRARFYVLRHTAMPAVLVEVGFLTGREDAKKLADPRYRSQVSEAIAAGIIQYVRSR